MISSTAGIWPSPASVCRFRPITDAPDDNIEEEREDFMISPSGGETTFRLAHFLTPSASSGESLLLLPPPSSKGFNFSCGEKESKSSGVKVNFIGWRYPVKEWKTWTDRMHSLHHSAWKEAGICDAIMNSTYKIRRNDKLIFGFVEKWCPDTNTFLFPWGEATITLEDVMILGGYSVVGDPVFRPAESSEVEEVEKKLLSTRSKRSRALSRASQDLWLRNFMGSGSEVEHEAFLALWLSRFVFPSKSRKAIIERRVLPVAIHLARGTKMALAPAVLANLYANLSGMKEARSTNGNRKYCIFGLSVSAPFQLVQIWVWERFSSLRPNPRSFQHDQPRFAKWHSLRMKSIGDVKLAIDEAADCFHWRPYSVECQGSFSGGIYKEEARWVPVGSDIDEELEILVRWLRVSELVGCDSDCIEQYLPHRVALQFGFDQDVPGHVARANSNQNMAWENYTRKIRDERLYVPPHLFESYVTTGYIEWWKKCTSAWNNDPMDTDEHCEGTKKVRLLSSLLEESPSSSEGSNLKKAFTNQEIPESIGKNVLPNSAGKNSHIGSLISSVLHVKRKTAVSSISHRKYGFTRVELLGDGNQVEDRAKKSVRLTGSLYKKAVANLLNSKSSGKRDSMSSSEKSLENDGVVPLGSDPEPNHVAPGHSEDYGGHHQNELLRIESGGQDISQNRVRLTGSEYKKDLANQVRPNNSEKRKLLISSGNDILIASPGFHPKQSVVGSKDLGKEDGQTLATHSRTDPDAKGRNQSYFLPPLGFLTKQNRAETGDSDDHDGQHQSKSLNMERDGKIKAQKDFPMESPTSVNIKTAAAVHNAQEEPFEMNSSHENEKGGSRTVLDGFVHSGPGSASGGSETQSVRHQTNIPSLAILAKAVAESSRKCNLNNGKEKSCSSYDQAIKKADKLEARIRNLEKLVGGYKRKHASAADNNEDCE